MARGIKKQDIELYLETESVVDFDTENLITRMINAEIVSEKNGYDNITEIKHP